MTRTIKKFAKFILIEKIGAFLTTISPVLNTQYCSLIHRRKLMNLTNPKSFVEKISWLKLNQYANDDLVRQCADKFAVRKYIKEKGLEYLLNDLIAVYENVYEINWQELPNEFVLKWNFGSGFNYLCRDKSQINIELVKKKLTEWQKTKFWLFYSELQYKVSKKYILCERYLKTENATLIDYKFYCFHGKVKAILVLERLANEVEHAVFMSKEWEYLSDVNYKYKASFIPEKPKSLDVMKNAAKKLSEDFPFVRVDFYEWQGKPVFGEMTFTPGAGMMPSETKINGKSMGEHIHL